MSSSYDHEALWLKAKLFLNWALEEGEHRTFDERALWASMALELLGKAALSKISPLLIAVPTEEGANILVAAGLISGDARFESFKASTLFKRCARAYKPFNDAHALAIAQARNHFLHGGEAALTKMPPEAWWPRYWALAIILVHAQDRDIDDLVGATQARVVEGHLATNAKNIEHRTEMLIARARQRLAQYEAGTFTATQAAEWNRPVPVAGLGYDAAARCPACDADGTLEGENVTHHEITAERVGDDDFDVWVDVTVDADYFGCNNCKLVLDSYELLQQAGLDTSFEAVGDVSDFAEPEYGND